MKGLRISSEYQISGLWTSAYPSIHFHSIEDSGAREVSSEDLLLLLLSIFSTELPTLREEMAQEALHWASEGFLVSRALWVLTRLGLIVCRKS